MAKEKPEKDKGTFTKISSKAVIKSCNIKPKCADLRFEKLTFSDRQYDQIAGLIKEGEEVLITITATQAKMDFEPERATD